MKPLDIFLVIGEPSGDQLGFKLMQALREQLAGAVRFRGLAGPAMTREGLDSLFLLDDIAVMGFAAVIKRFPTLYRRAWQTIRAVLADPPDVLVIVDSPDFTHAVARRVRRRLPGLPVVNYVSPSVWAWRPKRASAMRAYVDHVLALLPFEPAALARLGGPACTYVGHPLIERLDELRPNAGEAHRRESAPSILLALPGSRRSEIDRLTALFGETIARLSLSRPDLQVVLPTIERHRERVTRAVAAWPKRPVIVTGEAQKFAAFRQARAALAASGTVTLELALSGVPMVGAYRVPAVEAALARRLIKVSSVLLPNLVLGRRVFPERLQEAANPEQLAADLDPLIGDGPEREAQLAAFQELDGAMRLDDGERPSDRAARIVIEVAKRAKLQARLR